MVDMVLCTKSRIGLAVKGTRTPDEWQSLFSRSEHIKIFELSCFFDNEMTNIMKNLQEIKHAQKSRKIKISIHGPPIINIKSGCASYTFANSLKGLSIIINQLRPEWITVHGLTFEKELTKNENFYWLKNLQHSILGLPKNIKRLLYMENGFNKIFPITPEEFRHINTKLILDTSHAFLSGNQERITEFIQIYHPKHFHISDANKTIGHLAIGEGLIDFSFIKKTNATFIIETNTSISESRTLSALLGFLEK